MPAEGGRRKCYLATDRLLLFGLENDCHSAFADLLQELVMTDDRAGGFGVEGRLDGGDDAPRRRLQKTRLLLYPPHGLGGGGKEMTS